jgi:hypothetical protein
VQKCKSAKLPKVSTHKRTDEDASFVLPKKQVVGVSDVYVQRQNDVYGDIGPVTDGLTRVSYDDFVAMRNCRNFAFQIPNILSQCRC